MIEKIVNKLGMATKKQYIDIQQTLYDAQVILTQIESVGSTNSGNPYKTYATAIKETCKKYEGISDWGCYQTRSIIDVRAAFIIGNGIQVVERDPISLKSLPQKNKRHQKELDFIEAFIQHNDLDEEGAQEYAKEAELEGRTLFKLIPNKNKKTIDLRFLSYSTNAYEVLSSDEDYKIYEKVKYTIPGTTTELILSHPEFVYKKFAGRTDKVNDIMPKVATVLRIIEDLDKALHDLRKINNLFASPTPWFNCEDEVSAKNLYQKIKSINWKIGKFLVTSKATFNMVSTDVGGVEGIIKEITNCAKLISGVTGIPVHFLGLPDLMSNRSTSTDLFEMIIASTNKERKTWIGNYEEIFTKVIEMSNAEFGTDYNPAVVSCAIPHVTSAKLKELAEVWLPLYTANVVDLDYMLSMIPNADSEKIKAANTEAAKQILKEMKLNEKEDKEDENDE